RGPGQGGQVRACWSWPGSQPPSRRPGGGVVGAANRASIARVMVAVAVVLAAPDVRATSEVGNLFGGPTEAGAGPGRVHPAPPTPPHGTNVRGGGGVGFIRGPHGPAGRRPAPRPALAPARP